MLAHKERPLRVATRIALAGVMAAGCAHVGPGLGTDQQEAEVRRALFAAFQPSTLANCTLKRYGDPHDGGYLMCENLMGNAQAAYSYGIDARDDWGCDVSQQLRTTVHEYDCFNLTRPSCARGALQFHEECIGDRPTIEDGRPYDTLARHLARNGDLGKHLIVKMDVEGAEWDSLLGAPDSILDTIDQLVVEFHGTEEPRFVSTLEKLKRHFYLVNFHANNNACNPINAPLKSWVNEVLFVNKRVGVPRSSGGAPALPNKLDTPNNPSKLDCQG